MQLYPNATHPYFFLPQDTTLSVFVYTKISINPFDLGDAIAGKYTVDYLLVFHKGAFSYSANLENELQTNLANGTTIYWVDDLAQPGLAAASNIAITQKNKL